MSMGLVFTDLRTPDEIARDRQWLRERDMDHMMRLAHWIIDTELLGFPRPLPRV